MPRYRGGSSGSPRETISTCPDSTNVIAGTVSSDTHRRSLTRQPRPERYLHPLAVDVQTEVVVG